MAEDKMEPNDMAEEKRQPEQTPSADEAPVNQETPKEIGQEKSIDEELDLDEDLANALDLPEREEEESVDVDAVIAEADPSFSEEINKIAGQDFTGVVIEKDKVSAEVDEDAKVPSPLRSFINNLPADLKARYKMAAAIIVVMFPFAFLIYKGYVLPQFELPYVMSMDEFSQKTFSYPTDGAKVPLFDEFRTKAHTVEMPKTVINLINTDGSASYGEFKFSLVLRDKEFSGAIKAKQSEIIDLIQRVLEQISIQELESPMGKEKVKKIVRHKVNEYLEGKVVLGVYYQSVILSR